MALVSPTIVDPAGPDLRRLAVQAVRARSLIAEHLGRPLPEDDGDLDRLQELLDAGVIGDDDTYDLQCLGVVFGMRLADAVEGLDWVVVEDESGRDPALRFEDTSLLVFPLTIISKRIEDGIEVDVRGLFEAVAASLDELRGQVVRH